MINKIYKKIIGHKVIAAVAIIAAAGGGYYWYTAASSGNTVTKYVVEKAAASTITASVTGSGQTQAVTQIDVKPQVTETVIKVPVNVGEHVAAGQLLVALDPTNEAKALQQAQISLQSVQLSLAKLKEAPTASTMAQDRDAVTKAEEDLATASTTLEKDYQNGFDTLGSSFVDFQTVMMELQDFVGGADINKAQSNPDAYVNLMPNYLQASTLPYRNDVVARYAAAAAAYSKNLADYSAVSRNADPATLDNIFSETYATAQLVSAAVKSSKDMLNYVVNNYPTNIGLVPLPAITNTFQNDFAGYTNTVDGDNANIADAINTVASDKTAINDDAAALGEASDTLAQLIAGPDPLDIQSQQLSIEQAQLSVQTAEQNLDDCSIRAPIDGVVSAVDAVVGETVPSPAVSIVGKGQVAEITLNEVDAAKVAVGDPATLTFDAISGLSLAGKVIEIDPVGTVSQGVVNYNIQVGFNDTTSQVKPGMSVTAAIVTEVHADVIAVPNAAVKTQGSMSYIQVPSVAVSDSALAASAAGGIVLAAPVKNVLVTTGLSNDTMTEIVSGLQAGDSFIAQTITTSGSASASAGTSGSPAGGASFGRALGGGGGFIMRAGGGG